MRLEVDEGLAKLLDGIKKKDPSIYGRGHAGTVRFLANYYIHHKPLEQLTEDLARNYNNLLENLALNIEASLERVLPKTFAQTLTNILTFQNGAKQDARGPGSGQDPATRQHIRRRSNAGERPAADPGPAEEDTLK
jgi:hypothetical protein